MVMDKGLSVGEARNLVDSGKEFIDFIKFGFGTSLITPSLEEKIKIYKEAGVNPYFGGTLFEIFIVRNKFDEYRKFVDSFGLEFVEVSDGSMELDFEQKLNYIRILAKDHKVLSEVGSKQESVHLSNEKWINMINNEINAGSWKVIAEARESGTIGIYTKDGKPNYQLINDISANADVNKIIWEAPLKSQQAVFVQIFGTNVNLGNIPVNEVLSLETLRLGLRGDTFSQFLK